MGRLTYSARKTSGLKAGQSVSKDLKKRFPPGIGSKAAARDPSLEIDLEGKCLTDEGFAQFIDDLLKCIHHRDDEHPVGLAKITEFHLRGNNLTVHSLAKLGEVIANSSGDIRELDLSQNKISVVTVEEKVTWQRFLESFQNCYMLKKLDLSGNPLGVAGLEILARVYIKSDLEFVEGDAGAAIEEVPELAEAVGSLQITGKENESPRAVRAKKSPNKGKVKQNGSSIAVDLKKFACTRGLRSVPYFMISDINIKNSSAVHLSRMLATQRSSEYLLTYLPPGKASAIPECAQGDKSIIWQPNDGLTEFAHRLLSVTEQIAVFKAKSLAETESEDSDSDKEENQRKLQSKLALDYTRLTKRVRIESLKVEGTRASEIAVTALRMFAVSRALLLEGKDRLGEDTMEEPLEDDETAHLRELVNEELKRLEVEQVDFNEYSSPVDSLGHDYTFGSSFPGPFHPEAEMFDEQFPVLASAQLTKPSEETTQPSLETQPAEPNNRPYVRSSGKGNPRGSMAQKARKQVWRYNVPFDVWRRIIADAVGANGILDIDQQSRIIHYAADWDAVEYELSIKGVENHQQIWKFLETVGCFTYTPN
ncbi:hypothetical protein BJX99DRAFT_247525 [Aspergillus californicus]